MAERKQQEYADRLKSMQEEMERRQRELLEAQETIRRLEEQLRQLQKAKEELELSQKELHAMMKRLEEAKEMEAAEKLKLEEEIRAKQEEVQRIADEVSPLFFHLNMQSLIFSASLTLLHLKHRFSAKTTRLDVFRRRWKKPDGGRRRLRQL